MVCNHLLEYIIQGSGVSSSPEHLQYMFFLCWFSSKELIVQSGECLVQEGCCSTRKCMQWTVCPSTPALPAKHMHSICRFQNLQMKEKMLLWCVVHTWDGLIIFWSKYNLIMISLYPFRLGYLICPLSFVAQVST